MRKTVLVMIAALIATGFGAPTVMAQQTEIDGFKIPVATEPGIFTLKGEFVRIGYNNEGWVTLGYRLANDSQGDEWMLLEMGTTIRKPTKNQPLTRDSFTVTLPNGETVALATQEDYTKANSLRALNMRGNTIRDSINYFPQGAHIACKIGFFADPTVAGHSLSYDQFEASTERGCLGRLFFKVPGGITTGQYWLNVKFAGSTVQTPFRIMTKDEQKKFGKNWKSLKKQYEAFLKAEAEKAQALQN